MSAFGDALSFLWLPFLACLVLVTILAYLGIHILSRGVIADTYDVPIFLGAPPGNYAVAVTLYDAGSGAVFGTKDLKTIALAPDLSAPRRETWNISHTSGADFGAFALAG